MTGAIGDWVPILALSELSRRPRRVEVGDTPLVVWPGPWGRPVVFLDRCPHQDVRLSEGRRTLTGRLICDGHGWEFDAAGTCVRIPGRPLSDARGRHADLVQSRVQDEQVWVRLSD